MKSPKSGYYLYRYTCHLDVDFSSEQMNLNKKALLFFVQPHKKTTWQGPKNKESTYMETAREHDHLRNHHDTMITKGTYISNKLVPQNQSLYFIHKKLSSFSYQPSRSITKGLQQCCFLEKTNLHQLCELWQTPTQIWTFFLIQNWFHLLGCKFYIFRESWQQRFPTGTNSYNGRGRFQPVYAIEESVCHCSRKLC